MTAAPIRHMEAPVMSQRSGRAFSTIQSQTSDATNVDAAIGGVGASRRFGLDERQQVRKHDEREYAWKQPPDRLAKAQPTPERKAARDFGDSGANIDDSGLHRSNFPPQPLPFKAADQIIAVSGPQHSNNGLLKQRP
jgi:hypothetical protein